MASSSSAWEDEWEDEEDDWDAIGEGDTGGGGGGGSGGGGFYGSGHGDAERRAREEGAETSGGGAQQQQQQQQQQQRRRSSPAALANLWGRTKNALGAIGPLLAEAELRERGAAVLGRLAKRTSSRVADKLQKLGKSSKLLLDDGMTIPHSYT